MFEKINLDLSFLSFFDSDLIRLVALIIIILSVLVAVTTWLMNQYSIKMAKLINEQNNKLAENMIELKRINNEELKIQREILEKIQNRDH